MKKLIGFLNSTFIILKFVGVKMTSLLKKTLALRRNENFFFPIFQRPDKVQILTFAILQIIQYHLWICLIN